MRTRKEDQKGGLYTPVALTLNRGTACIADDHHHQHSIHMPNRAHRHGPFDSFIQLRIPTKPSQQLGFYQQSAQTHLINAIQSLFRILPYPASTQKSQPIAVALAQISSRSSSSALLFFPSPFSLSILTSSCLLVSFIPPLMAMAWRPVSELSRKARRRSLPTSRPCVEAALAMRAMGPHRLRV